MSLEQEIDARRAEIRTDGYGMSVGEWISLYEKGELDIHPEFQRIYRWGDSQKSRLIESLLLGIPIPPIFVSQRKDGVWDVVDGLQRLSTIFQFVGILKDEENKLVPPLVLKKTKYLPSLEGMVWDHELLADLPTQIPLFEEENNENLGNALNSAQRLLIKRAKISVSIILKESDERSKYDLFQRLNTGGSSLSSQELRNCILIAMNRNVYLWLEKLSQEEDFKSCVSLTERATNEQYDLELILRFLVFYKLEEVALKNIGDLDDFLTEQMERVAQNDAFNKEEEEKVFKETFHLLANTVEENSFRRYDISRRRFVGGFLVSAFEAVALGIAYNIKHLDQQKIDIEKKIKSLWQMPQFSEGSGSGVRASTRIPKVIPLGRSLFHS